MLLTRPGVLFAGLISLCALAATAALPAVPDTAILIPFAVLAIAWAVGLMLTDPDNRPAEHPDRLGLGRHRRQGRLGAARELLLHLAPVGLLMVIYPIAAQRIDTSVGGTPLLTILLASSVTVPWLSQSACLPLYRAVGDLLPLTKETLIWWLCQGCGVEGWPGLGLARLPLAPAIPSDLPLWGRCGRFRAGYRRAVTPPGRRPGPASASSSWRTGPADGCGSWPGRGSGS